MNETLEIITYRDANVLPNVYYICFSNLCINSLNTELTGILVSGGVRWGEGAGGGHKGAQADHHGYMCPGILGMPVFSY